MSNVRFNLVYLQIGPKALYAFEYAPSRRNLLFIKSSS